MKHFKYFLVLVGGWILAYFTSDHELTSSPEVQRMDSEMYFIMIVFTIIFLSSLFVKYNRKKGV